MNWFKLYVCHYNVIEALGVLYQNINSPFVPCSFVFVNKTSRLPFVTAAK